MINNLSTSLSFPMPSLNEMPFSNQCISWFWQRGSKPFFLWQKYISKNPPTDPAEDSCLRIKQHENLFFNFVFHNFKQTAIRMLFSHVADLRFAPFHKSCRWLPLKNKCTTHHLHTFSHEFIRIQNKHKGTN